MNEQKGGGPNGVAAPHPGYRATLLGLRLHLVLMCLALLLPALLAGGLTAWQLGAAYRQASETGLRGTARATAAAIDQQLTTAITAAVTLAGSLDRSPGGPAALSGFYAQARAVGEAFGGWVVLAQADGSQLLNTLHPLGQPLPRARGLPWITRALETGEAVLSDRLFTGGTVQRPILAAFVPLREDAGPRTVLILAFEPARLATLLGQIREGQIAGLIEVESGRIVARSVAHESQVGQVAPRWVAEALAREEGGVTAGPSIEGAGIVLAFQRLEGVPWAAAVTMPRQAYDMAWQSPLLNLALGGLALLLAAMLLAAWRARRFLAPLDALTAEAEAVAAGRPVPAASSPFTVAEFETLRQAMGQATTAMRARAMAEGRAAAALEMMAALRTERDRARLYFDAAGTMLLVLSPEGAVQGINRHGLEILGLAEEAEVLGQDWFAGFVAARWQARARAAFRAINEGAEDAPEPDLLPVLRPDGEERLVAWRSTALRDPEGNFLALLASGEDITERRASEERQVLLMQEVDHRAKNALALVQSIIRLTRADHPADFADAVEGRVGALARAYTLLARERWAGSDLRELAEAELAAYAAGGRVALSGPVVRLAPEVVQPMSMVLYELASNAARHGALSTPQGRVTLSWERAAGGALRLEWTELGGPALVAGQPTRRGFGSRMIKVAVSGQLGGSLAFDWRPTGLACVLTVAPDRVSIRQARAPLPPLSPPAPVEEAASLATVLHGRRVLLAEDEALVGLELAETLTALGCVVSGPAASLSEAMQLAEQAPLDLAVLDVNLRGQAAFPVADLLVRRGVPVLFVTGYGEMPGGWAAGDGQGRTALLRKPLASGALGGALRRLLDSTAPRPPVAPEPLRGAPPPSRLLRGCG
ncbi:HWE histidine kinase domain-containing protein [Teichococcus aestuarii]|uniref:HWE histidine kinase domain-containing protein n=1 Tax=Teichococcus aestuarii TaxID=568898 RepID=UPI003623461A